MSINLLKRLESSVNSFQLTLQRMKALIDNTIEAINRFEKYGNADIDMYEVADSEWDMDDGNTEYFTVGKKVKIELADMDYKTWRTELMADAETLELLTLMVADITPEHDSKLKQLLMLNAVHDLCFLIPKEHLSKLSGFLTHFLSPCYAVIVVILQIHRSFLLLVY